MLVLQGSNPPSRRPTTVKELGTELVGAGKGRQDKKGGDRTDFLDTYSGNSSTWLIVELSKRAFENLAKSKDSS